MSDKRVEVNTEWSNRLDKIIADTKRKLMQPNFTGSVVLELHASDGMIKKVVEGEHRHHSLARS